MNEGNTVAAGGGARWLQLLLGVVAMTMIANLQYGWTLFVNPLQQAHGWSRASIQVAFTLFIVAETWLVPVNGFLVDRFGPRAIVLAAGVLVGLSWTLNAVVDSLPILYLAQTIGGIGAGAVYGACVGNALKWFPDRRGLAAGVTAAGFGMGSALTVVPISMTIDAFGYRSAFLGFGLVQGLALCAVSFALRPPGWATKAPETASAKRQYAPLEMLRTPVFWLMYAMFVMMACGGLMATAQLGPIAKDFGVDKLPVSMLGLTLPALTLALSLDRVLNGLTRPLFGWVSDRIGREPTMFVAFGLEGLATIALSLFGRSPVPFVLLTGLVFFAWGEIYSLFPATCGDAFGEKYATSNTGALYTAKGTAALLVPFSSLLVSATGDWRLVFYIAAGLNLATAVLALAALRPMRKAMARRDWAPLEQPGLAADSRLASVQSAA